MSGKVRAPLQALLETEPGKLQGPSVLFCAAWAGAAKVGPWCACTWSRRQGLGSSGLLHAMKSQVICLSRSQSSGAPDCMPVRGDEERVRTQWPVLFGLLTKPPLPERTAEENTRQPVSGGSCVLQAFRMEKLPWRRSWGKRELTLQKPGERATWTRKEDPVLLQCCSRAQYR